MRACTGVRDDLIAWLDGELEVARAREVQRHVQGCSSCEAAAARPRALVGLLEEDPRPAVVEGFVERVAAAAAAAAAGTELAGSPGTASRDPHAGVGGRGRASPWAWWGLALAASVAGILWITRPTSNGHGAGGREPLVAARGGERSPEASPRSGEARATSSADPTLEGDDLTWIEENWDALVFLEEVDLDAMLDEDEDVF